MRQSVTSCIYFCYFIKFNFPDVILDFFFPGATQYIYQWHKHFIYHANEKYFFIFFLRLSNEVSCKNFSKFISMSKKSQYIPNTYFFTVMVYIPRYIICIGIHVGYVGGICVCRARSLVLYIIKAYESG